MIAPSPIIRRRAEVGHALGLHLRPASRFAEVAQRFDAEVRVRCDGSTVDGKSVIALLCLAAGPGSVLELEARGHDADRAVAALVDLLSPRCPEAQASPVS